MSGCATDLASRSELGELAASVRALRAENARLEAKLNALEDQRTRAEPAPKRSPAPAIAAAPPSEREPLPSLTVVKLKPRREAKISIPTEVLVEEPPEGLALELTDNLKAEPMDEGAEALAQSQFNRGLDMLKTGNPGGGVAQLLQFVTDWPKHPKADNALFLAGTGLMGQRDFEAAAKLFDDVSKKYPAGDAVLDSMLKVAECRLRLNRVDEARAVYQQIVSTFPGTIAATQAQSKLSEPRSPVP